MAWQIAKGPRKRNVGGGDGGLVAMDFLITFVGVTGTDDEGALAPAFGDTVGDIVATATALDTTAYSLDAEPTAVQVSDTKYLTNGTCASTVRFRAFVTE